MGSDLKRDHPTNNYSPKRSQKAEGLGKKEEFG